MKNIRLFPVLLSIIAFFSSCTDYGLNVHKVTDHLFVILGEGGNSGVFICDTAVLIIDSKMKQGAERMHRWVESKAPHRKVYIVNTHVHKDHTGGNHLYDHPIVIAGDYGDQFWNAISAREDMPTRWLSDTLSMPFGDDVVRIVNVGQAHTFDDVIVYLKKRQILFTGDVVLNHYHPFLDDKVGSNVDDYLRVIDDMLFNYDPKIVVPGHGEIGDKQTITDFKNYFMDMKEVAANGDLELTMREKYVDYLSLPINKAGFDETVKYIQKSGTLR